MKSKITTRAMAVFLAVVLSFTLIVPYTFATGDEDVDVEGANTEILYEPIEDEDSVLLLLLNDMNLLCLTVAGLLYILSLSI